MKDLISPYFSEVQLIIAYKIYSVTTSTFIHFDAEKIFNNEDVLLLTDSHCGQWINNEILPFVIQTTNISSLIAEIRDLRTACGVFLQKRIDMLNLLQMRRKYSLKTLDTHRFYSENNRVSFKRNLFGFKLSETCGDPIFCGI